MKVLISGEEGVVAAGLVPELLRRAHSVRLLSRDEGVGTRWERVEPFAADVDDPASLRGAAGGCDAVIHAGTFGAESILGEAMRAGARRFMLVVPLNAEIDEPHVPIDVLIVRHASIYGPGDDVITPLFKTVRTAPVVPVIDGQRMLRPIWYEDFAKALVSLLERRERGMHTYEIAGAEETSLNDLIDRIRGITARKPIRVSIPAFSREGEPGGSSLRSLGVDETPLDRGLRKLADSLPEQFPDDGVGAMHHKRFWADISGSSHSAPSLMSLFRERVDDIMPIDFSAEPGAPSKIRRGMTMTMKLPLRGHVQIRVEKDEPAHIVFATIEGHPIAGMVEFNARDLPGGIVRFEIDNFARAANMIDYAALRTIGEAAQSANWRTVVQNMIEASGGSSDGVHVRTQKLTEAQVAQIENDVRAMVRERLRAESSAAERPA